MNIARYSSAKSSVAFWHTSINYLLYDFQSLEKYYIDLSSKTEYTGPYLKGLPYLDYKGSIGKQMNPCAIAQYGLGCYITFKNGIKKNETGFLRAANWLLENITIIRSNIGVWYYNFDLDAYHVKAPWGSALAQGQAVSLLLRTYLHTKQDMYLNCAKMALNAMILPIEEGGFLFQKEKEIYFEEVVSDRLVAILDGMIFSIFGVYDYFFLTKDPKIKVILDNSIETIKTILPKYDLGFWSRADLYNQSPPMIASYFYHNLHIEQLKALYHLTGETIFEFYYKKWEDYQKSVLLRWNALIRKIYFKLRYY